MEITTLITWNGLVYLVYYGANIAFDYYRAGRNHEKQPTRYSYKELLQQTPVSVSVPEFTVETAGRAVAQEINKAQTYEKKDSPVILTGPVEDQGIPHDEFIKNSRHYSTSIDF